MCEEYRRIPSLDLEQFEDYDGHEEVWFCSVPSVGLKAYIAIHNTNRGPSLGGCRMYPFSTEKEALTDVLRLSRGMTYKSALAELPLGGGKAVIIGDPKTEKTDELLFAFSRFVDSLGGRYITAEDVGTSVDDMKKIATQTKHVAGIFSKKTLDGNSRDGDPSPATAYGVYLGIKAALLHKLGLSSLKDVLISVQGVGHVGIHLCQYLAKDGAVLTIADSDGDAISKVIVDGGFCSRIVSCEDIYRVPATVFAPCAMGAILNDTTIDMLHASGVAIIAGAANNQLAEPKHALLLHQRGILYAPDYCINAGGVIDVFVRSADDLLEKLENIENTLTEIFKRSSATGEPTHIIADRLAEERFKKESIENYDPSYMCYW